MYLVRTSQLLHVSDDGDRADMADLVVLFGSDLITVESEAGNNVKEEGEEGWHEEQTMKDSKTDDDKDHLEEDDKRLRRCKEHPEDTENGGDRRL